MIAIGNIHELFLFDHQFVYPGSFIYPVETKEDYFTDYSTEDIFFKHDIHEDGFATLEPDFTRVDGSMHFLPRASTPDIDFARGMVSKNILSIGNEVKFGLELGRNSQNWSDGLCGFTLIFGKDCYPVDFDFTYRDYVNHTDVTIEVRGNDSYIYTYTGNIHMTIYTAYYLNFEFYTMSKPNRRLRLYSIILGEGIVYDNTDIVNASTNTYYSEVCDTLPQIDFEVTLLNKTGIISIEDPNYSIDMFPKGAYVDLYYGLQMPDETIEWISGDRLVLLDATINKYNITLTAKDMLSFYDRVYCAGRFHFEPDNVYDTFLQIYDIFDYCAKNRPLKYVLYHDQHSQEVFERLLVNALPPVSSKEAVQMVLNAAACSGKLVKYHGDWGGDRDDVEEKVNLIIRAIDSITAEDFLIEKKDMLSEPTISIIEPVQDIDMYYTIYMTDDVSGDVHILHDEDHYTEKFPGEQKTYTWDTPYRITSVQMTSYDKAVVKKTGPYYALIEIVDHMNPGDGLWIDVYGLYPQRANKSFVNVPINDYGHTIKWDNPLIHTSEWAKEIAGYMREFYSEDMTYEYDTRGFPELEVGDVIYQENDFVENMKVRIIELSLDFNGAFSGHMKVRRLREEAGS